MSAWLSIDCNIDWRLCGLISDGAVASSVMVLKSKLVSTGAAGVTESPNDGDVLSAEVVSKSTAGVKPRSNDCAVVD